MKSIKLIGLLCILIIIFSFHTNFTFSLNEINRIVRGTLSHTDIHAQLFQHQDFDTLIDYEKLSRYLKDLDSDNTQKLFKKIDDLAKEKGFENLGVQARYIYFKLLAKGGRSLVETSDSLPVEIKQKLYVLIDEEKDFSFATLSQVIFEWLIDEGKFDQLKKGHLLNGPKAIFVSPIKYPEGVGTTGTQGDAVKHRIGNRYMIYQQTAHAMSASYLDLYGVETLVFDLGLGREELDRLRDAIDERTYFISFRVNSPVNKVSLDTIFLVQQMIQEKIPDKDKRPILVAGGNRAAGNSENLLELTPLQIIFRTYGETNLTDMVFSDQILDSRDEKMFSYIPNIYIKDYITKEQESPYLTRYISITSRSHRRLKISMRALDFTKIDYRKYWELNPDIQDIHPENTYMVKNLIYLWTTHGDCKRGCEFCDYTGYSTIIKGISAEEIVNLVKRAIEVYPEAEMIYFMDGDFLFNRQRAREFAQLFKEEFGDSGIKLSIFATVFTANPKLLQELKDAGVEVIIFGNEVADEDLLRDMGKLKPGESYERFIEMPIIARQMGISTVRTTWIPFYPTMTQIALVSTVKQITEFLKLGIHAAISAYVMARPGAKVMERVQSHDPGAPFYTPVYYYELPNGQKYPIQTIILPNNPVVRKVAEKSIKELNATIGSILSQYSWVGDYPEQIEVLGLLKVTLENLKKVIITPEIYPGITDEMIDENITTDEINSILREINSLIEQYMRG